MINYKEIFDKAERSLKKQSWLTDNEFNEKFGRYKMFENKKRTDQELFELLILIIFYWLMTAANIMFKCN